METGGIIVLCIVVLLLVAAVLMIRIFNKLSIKKMVSEGKYVDLDDLFIRRYEALPKLFELCGGGGEAENQRELAIHSERAEERVEHDKLMSEALAKLREDNADKLATAEASEVCAELDKLAEDIAKGYEAYNKATKEYEDIRRKPSLKWAVRFFSFEEKPFF